jgi:hypothetical protein
VGGACSAHARDEKCVRIKFWLESMKGRKRPFGTCTHGWEDRVS